MAAPDDGVIPSPNIWNHPDVYEVENLGVDPDGLIEAEMMRLHDWAGGHVLDIGCGSGFHLPRFAQRAAKVTGAEPHPPMVELARGRVAGLPTVTVLEAPAQALPLPDHSVDVAHARFAYFFGPGCEPGLAEVARVLRPGGTAFVVDNDLSRSTYGRWFRTAMPSYDGPAVERFWRRQGFASVPVPTRWSFATREEFEAVVRIEFEETLADGFLAEQPGTGVDHAMTLRWRTY